MNAPLRQAWTQERFLAWSGHQEGRYEFDGVQPVAMTGGTETHSTIAGNIFFALRLRLRGSPCRPLNSDAGVSIDGKAVRYPDALVTCTKSPGTNLTVPGVVVVFEVVSPSSAPTDRLVKVREYASVPSIRRYVIAESGYPGVTVLERAEAGQAWTAGTLTIDDVLSLPELDIDVPVAELYEGVDFTGSIEAGPDTSGR